MIQSLRETKTPARRRWLKPLAAGALTSAVLGLGLISTAAADDNRGAWSDQVRVTVDVADHLSDAQVKALGMSAGLNLTLDNPFNDEPNIYSVIVPADQVDTATEALGKLVGVEAVAPSMVMADDHVELVIDAEDALSDAEVKAIGRSVGMDFKLNSTHADDENLYVGWVHVDRAEAAMDAIAATDGVEFVEPNMTMQAFGAPNDPLYQYQWHFEQIDVEKTWGKTTGAGVVVAVIDTGVAYKDKKDEGFTQTPDLKGTKFVEGYDFVSKDKEPLDEHGHGTHVAGTIAQTTNNGYGVAGVAYNAKIMPLRVLNKSGFGSVADIADSIRFAADNGAHVINMSLGGPLPSLVMRSAVKHAHEKGTTIIAAAGNSGRRMKSYPAAYNHVVAVAATQYDKKTTFYSQWGPFVDIAAPGGNTRVDQNRDGRPDGVMQQTLKRGSTSEHEFALYMGTSMASPHAAAVAAMIISNGVTNPDKVEELLKSTANDSGRERIDKYAERYGAGIINADAATGQATWTPGITRIAVAIFVLLLLLMAVSRQDALGKTDLKKNPAALALGIILASSGFFFLKGLCGSMVGCEMTLDLISRPLAMLDLTILGPGHHQNALLASALLPFGAMAVGLNAKHLKTLCTGLAIGFAGFLLAEAYMMTSDVQWIPGAAGILDRVWLATNGIASATLAYLSMKRY